MEQKTILIIGTYDTKEDELSFLADALHEQGARTHLMDVSVLGDTAVSVNVTKHEIAAAANTTITAIIALEDENLAFQQMALGASKLTANLNEVGTIDGVIVLGGTMGTDLALDVVNVLPMGVPKYIVSTVAFSPLIPTERIAPDVQMILWAGGLYGLNSLCKSTLLQAAGAVHGAAKAVGKLDASKPMIGMTSLGKTTLRYMVHLLPELEKRGFEVAVFHSTGLGGRAFETLVAQGRFVCVMDFCLQEFINGVNGSAVGSGDDRLTNAGINGTPQLIAPGATDIIDFLAASGPPPHLADREHHAHNRLIDSVLASPDERADLAKEISDRLQAATGPVHMFLPLQGVEEWDRVGNPCHNPDGLKAFNASAKTHIVPNISTDLLDCHINDRLFTDSVLAKFDDWCAKGIIKL